MKLASFVADGKDCFGAVVGDDIITLSGKLPYPSLRDALTDRGGLAAIEAAVKGARPDRKLADVRLLPVIPNPERSSAPASTTARMRPKPAAICRSSRACSSGSPTR